MALQAGGRHDQGHGRAAENQAPALKISMDRPPRARAVENLGGGW
jgi:hypothetical protein